MVGRDDSTRLPQLSQKARKERENSGAVQRLYVKSKAANDIVPDEYLDAVGVGFSKLAIDLEWSKPKRPESGKPTTLGEVVIHPNAAREIVTRGVPGPRTPSPDIFDDRLHLVPFSEVQNHRDAIYDAYCRRLEADMEATEKQHEFHQARIQQSSWNRIFKPIHEKQCKALQHWLPVIVCVNKLNLFRRCWDVGRAFEVLRNVFLPIWRAHQILKKQIQRRQALSEARLEVMRPPEVRVLQSSSLFDTWPEKNIKALISSMVPICFTEGEFIIMQGIKGNVMYLIDSGCVGAHVTAGGKGRACEMLILTLTRPMMFGEMALICDEPHEMTIRCLQDTDCWALTRKDFMARIAEMGPNAPAQNVVTEKSKQYRVASLVKNSALQLPHLQAVPLFKSWPAKTLERLVTLFEPMVTSAGDVILHQGDKGVAMYFVTNGILTAHLKRSNGTIEEVAEITAGEIFGEVPCLFLEPVNVTVTCKTNCALWMLPKQRFVDELLGNALLLLQAKEVSNQKRAAWIEKLPLKHLSAVLKKLYPQIWKKMLSTMHSALQPRVFADGDILCSRTHPCNQIIIVVDGKAQSEMGGQFLGPGIAFGQDSIGATWKDTIRAVGKVEVWFLFDTQLQKAAEKVTNPDGDQGL